MGSIVQIVAKRFLRWRVLCTHTMASKICLNILEIDYPPVGREESVTAGIAGQSGRIRQFNLQSVCYTQFTDLFQEENLL